MISNNRIPLYKSNYLYIYIYTYIYDTILLMNTAYQTRCYEWNSGGGHCKRCTEHTEELSLVKNILHLLDH